MRMQRYVLPAALAAFMLPGSPLLAKDDTPLVPLPTVRAWNPRQTPVVDVVRRVKDAVVNIHSERTVKAPAAEELFALAPSQHRVNGMGTGIVIDPRGYIVTNHHVVEDVSLLRVRLADGATVSAKVVARDAESDLALLKISPPKPLPVMPLGTAKDLQVGETVVAIGNAYGYDHTVTVGAVSAVGRDVSLNKDVRYKALIQTDAAINPGNSGGPLVNLAGELVGVNVAIRAGAQGIGFAIPVDSMIGAAGQMLAQLRTKANVAPVGLAARDDLKDVATSRQVIVETADGAANKAGLRKGDVVVKVGDQAVASTLDVERALLEREGGSQVDVVVRRGGRDQTVKLTLEAAPQKTVEATTVSTDPAGQVAAVWQQFGLRLFNLPDAKDVTRAFPQLRGGLLIGDVRADSPAAKAGMKKGDVLVGLHKWEMLSIDNVLYVMNHPERATFSPLRYYILRGGQVTPGWLQVGE